MSAKQCIDFEKPIVELEDQLNELKRQYLEGRSELKNVISALAKKIYSLKRKVYSNLTPWQVTHQIARHPNRPHTMDYVRLICEDFIELHGDRSYKDDPAMIGGIARIDGCSIVIIGHQKGTTTKEKIYRNFGMPNPEGYRKAMRLMLLAERFNKPVVTLIDTPGAYPGVGAEERGQSEAIARNLMVMSRLRTPTVSVVIGEGGSGGALAIGVSDRVMMMQYATYSVISPEGCAAILWKDGNKVDTAAQSLKLTSKDLLKLGIIDQIIKEPLSLAHNDPVGASKNLKKAIIYSLKELYFEDRDTLLRARYDKFRRMGVLREVT